MVDQAKPRQIVVPCDACGETVVLYELDSNERLRVLEPTATFKEKTCDHCGHKALYGAMEWREVEA